mgnify:CR=1 FL=1
MTFSFRVLFKNSALHTVQKNKYYLMLPRFADVYNRSFLLIKKSENKFPNKKICIKNFYV